MWGEESAYTVVFFIEEMDHADVVFECYDVRFGKCFHGRHVCASCFEGAEAVFGEADRIELGNREQRLGYSMVQRTLK